MSPDRRRLLGATSASHKLAELRALLDLLAAALQSPAEATRGEPPPEGGATIEQNASAQAARSSGARPAIVVMRRPATRRTGVTHATRGEPSTSTVQQPHWPCGLHPSFGVRAPTWSRSASSSDPADSGTTTASPSTSRSTGRDWACTDRG